MDFGVVLQTDPPGWRTVQLAELAEAHGFSHLWTFDSHLLWQEPYVLYSQILARTQRLTVGPMVTNPSTRDWTVTASLFATLNEMFGNRTVCGIGRGDSAVRVTNGKPATLKEVRDATHVIRELANCRAVDYKGSRLQFPWAHSSSLEVWVAAYGPLALKAAGEVGDGIKNRQGYDYNEHGRAGNTHAAFVPDDIVDRFCILGTADDHIAKLKQLKDIGVDQFAGYLQHDNKEETLRVYGETIIPALREHVVAKA